MSQSDSGDERKREAYMKSVIIKTPEHGLMREKVALEHGFALPRQYSEKQAAAYFRCDLSTLKRWRRSGLVPYVRMGVDGVKYLGTQIADVIILGTGGWDDMTSEPSKSVNGGSGNEAEAPPTTDVDSLPDKSSAYHSARRILKKQSKG